MNLQRHFQRPPFWPWLHLTPRVILSPVEDATENASLRGQSYCPAELSPILEVGVQLKLCPDVVQVGHLARDSSMYKYWYRLNETNKKYVPSQWPWLVFHSWASPWPSASPPWLRIDPQEPVEWSGNTFTPPDVLTFGHDKTPDIQCICDSKT